MNSDMYSRQLELKLIENFQREFYSKMGYFPHIITKHMKDEFRNLKPFMTLEELADKFKPFMPVLAGEKMKLRSQLRKREVVEMRHIFTFIAKTMGYSHKTIAHFLGKKDHSTTINSMRVFEDLYQTSDNFREKFETINQYINSELNIQYDPSTMDHPYQTQGESQPPVLS
jgi:hypothetical protein